MRNKEEFAKLMTQISEKAGDNAEIMEMLKSAQDDYNESMDKAPVADNSGDLQVKYDDLNNRYNNLVNEYRNRFFGVPVESGSTAQLQPTDVPGVPQEIPKDDPSAISFDTLFEENK